MKSVEQDVNRAVRDALASVLWMRAAPVDGDWNAVSDTSLFADGLGLDSIEFATVVVLAEERLNLGPVSWHQARVRTVADLVDVLVRAGERMRS